MIRKEQNLMLGTKFQTTLFTFATIVNDALWYDVMANGDRRLEKYSVPVLTDSSSVNPLHHLDSVITPIRFFFFFELNMETPIIRTNEHCCNQQQIWVTMTQESMLIRLRKLISTFADDFPNGWKKDKIVQRCYLLSS